MRGKTPIRAVAWKYKAMMGQHSASVQHHTRIHLLRHGETVGGARFCGTTDVGTTMRGWQQMCQATGLPLNTCGRSAVNANGRIAGDSPSCKPSDGAPAPWDRVIASPLLRCAAFARVLAGRWRLPVGYDPRLREMHFGAWEGCTAAQLVTEDGDALARFWRSPLEYPPPGGEPLTAFAVRVMSAWNAALNRYAGERLLLITHGGVIRVILSHVLRRPLERLLELDVAHGSMHCIEATGSRTGSRARQVGQRHPR